MRADPRRLARLRRLEHLRAIAKATAAGEAAAAEATLAALHALAARTGDLAGAYAARVDAGDGGELRLLASFAGGLETVRGATLGDAARARHVADSRQSELALAERRRAAVADRVARAARLAAKPRPIGDYPASRLADQRFGTGLE